MEHLVDAHYVSLPSQGNVYSLAPLALAGGGSGAHKLLLATLRRRVLSFRYAYTHDSVRLKPLVREVHFTCIPSWSEIISIDAFSRTRSGEDYVIGITIIKPSPDGGRPDTYLNIYMEQDCEAETSTVNDKGGIPSTPSEASLTPGSGSGANAGNAVPGLDNAAQNCIMLELGFVPYQLSHAILPGGQETVWILGGSDCRIHTYREDLDQHCYAEVATDSVFPELGGILPSPPLWSDVRCVDSDIRICAVGCECGYVRVAQTRLKDEECEIVARCELQLQGPVSCVRFFTLRNEMHWQPSPKHGKHTILHLLVVCALQPSQIFMDVCSNGLTNGMELPGSASGDAVLCGALADVDLDGSVEVLLGTYGRQLLVYKWIPGSWELRATRTLPHPVHGLHYLDVTGDGARELLILTPRGLHVFQHHVEDVENRMETFIQNLSAYLSKNAQPNKNITDAS